MKVIKPLQVVRDTYTDVNSRDVVPVWSGATTYGASSTFDKVWVQYNGILYESVKPLNLNNTPASTSTWWKTVTSLSTDDFAKSVWNNSTTYSTGDIVYYQIDSSTWPKYYQSLQNSNLNKIPSDNLSGSSPYWLDLGYTNISKLYDIETNTQTITTDELITTFTARKAGSAGIFGASGNRVLITAKSERNLYSTTDWTSVDLGETSAPQLKAMVFSPDKNVLLLCGRNGYLKYSKNNGITWTICTTPTGSPHLLSLAYNSTDGIFIATGTSNDSATCIIWKSLDGINWTNITGLPTSSVSLNKAIWVEQLNKFVIAASNGNIYVSNDGTGTTWTSSSVGAGTSDLVGIVYNPANGLTHVVGNLVLRYSSDLSSWTAISTNRNIKSIELYNSVDEVGNSTYQYGAIGTANGQPVLDVSTNGTSFSSAGGVIGQSGTGIALAYCYTENKWVIISTVLNLQTLFYRSTADPAYTSITPSVLAFDTSYTQVFYNKSTDTIFLFGDNNKIITSPNIYFQEYSLNSSLVDNWYDYFYQDYNLLTEAIFQNIPIYTRTRITVSIVGDIVRCGIVFAGTSSNIGITQYGASAGIIDYSKKETDEFGTTTFIRRAFSKRMNVNLILPSSDLYRVQKILSDIRATPCVWIGSEDEVYKPLIMYGYYRDFNLEIPYPEYSYCSLQVEGLTE